MHLKKLCQLAVCGIMASTSCTFAQSGSKDRVVSSESKLTTQAIDKLVSRKTSIDNETLFKYAESYAQAGEKSKAIKTLNRAVNNGFWFINRIKENQTLNSVLGKAEIDKLIGNMRQQSTPYTSGKAVLSKEEKASIISFAQGALAAFYFDPKLQKEMSDEIGQMLKDGHFDKIDTVSKFNGELINYFRKKTNDKHFYIGVDYGQLTERVPNLSVTTPEERNFGFRNVSVRDGNIGYIRWDECIAGPEAYKTAQSALTLMRNTRAIVIDISGNGGGNGEISTFLYHYLFKPDDKRFETLLIKKCKGEADWRRSEPPVEPLPGGPDLGDKPIYIVTSGNTFSAAEYFAFMMKELKRATIIGKNTGGGGNPVNMMSNGRYMMYVPTCQITTNEGKSLEGKGVAPDIEFKTQEWTKEIMDVVNADLKKNGK